MTWLGLAPIVLLLGSMFAMSFSGLAPARVEVVGRDVRVTMQGVMPVYALRRRLVLEAGDIQRVHADEFAQNLFGGFRVGTRFPKVMTAGWFWRGEGRGWDFFAVYRARSALVIDLVPGRRRFRRVIVEVDDLHEAAAAVGAVLAPAA